MLELFVGAIYFLLGIVGWFLKEALDASKDTKERLNDFRVEVAQQYTHKNDLRDIMVNINERFDRIEKKLDRIMEARNG